MLIIMSNQKDLQGLAREDKPRKCPECKSTDLDYIDGELVCKSCGLVIE